MKASGTRGYRSRTSIRHGQTASEEIVHYRPGGAKAAYAEVKAAAAHCGKRVTGPDGLTESQVKMTPRSSVLAADQLTVTVHLTGQGQAIWTAAVYQYDSNLFIGIYTFRPTAAQALHVARALAGAITPRLKAAAAAGG